MPQVPTPSARDAVALGASLFLLSGAACVPSPAIPSLRDRAALIPSASTGVGEPSGVTFHALRKHLYVVGDEGRIAELDGAGRLLRTKKLHGDLEDVGVTVPQGDLLVLCERRSRLLLVDAKTLKKRRRWRLAHADLLGRWPHSKRQGFEGLCFVPGARRAEGLLLLAHQSKPASLMMLAFDPAAKGKHRIGSAAIRDTWLLGSRREVTAVAQAPEIESYLVIDRVPRHLLVLSRDGYLDAEIPLPGVKPEGLCLDDRGDLWVADDRQGLWHCPGALRTISARASR